MLLANLASLELKQVENLLYVGGLMQARDKSSIFSRQRRIVEILGIIYQY